MIAHAQNNKMRMLIFTACMVYARNLVLYVHSTKLRSDVTISYSFYGSNSQHSIFISLPFTHLSFFFFPEWMRNLGDRAIRKLA